MKFLVDAQLPPRLARFLRDAVHDAVHTSELPDGNRMPDRQIAEFVNGEGRVEVHQGSRFPGQPPAGELAPAVAGSGDR
jgi:predicted nuclease of predicted toxin-antitoxin system